MHAPEGSYHKPALPKKSRLCQAFSSLMGGVRSQHWTSQSTCRAPRRHQHTAAEQQCIPRGERSQLDLLRRRRGTYLPLRPRTNRKMDPALAGLLSAHANTLERWLTNMAPSYRPYMMPPRNIRNAAKEARQMKQPELPVVAPELTSELLHCLSTLPDPWPLAKITINMDSVSQWVSRMCRLFFADDYIRHTEGTPPASQTPNMESAFQAVQNALPKLENRVIEFLAEWLVALLAPARHVLETRSPHLSFMLLKEYWFRELYLSLKVTASFDRTESYVRVIDGQVRCITPDFKNQDLHVAMSDSPYVPQLTPGKRQKHGLRKLDRGQICSSHLVPRHNSHQGTSTKLRTGNTRTHAWPSRR